MYLERLEISSPIHVDGLEKLVQSGPTLNPDGAQLRLAHVVTNRSVGLSHMRG